MQREHGELLARKVAPAAPMRGRSLTVPPEEAFSFHVPLSLPFFTDLWTAGERREVPDFRLGDAQLVDLRDNPRVSLDTPFDSLRFYIPQIALDEMANEEGIRRGVSPTPIATDWKGDSPDQSGATGMGELLRSGAFQRMLQLHQRQGGEEGQAPSGACSETKGLRLGTME
jgi:hypothetical protein